MVDVSDSIVIDRPVQEAIRSERVRGSREDRVMDEQGDRVDPDKMRATYEASRRRASKAPMVTHRAVARIEEDLHMSGRVGRFELESDEPAELGGGGGAPTALQYVVAGAAF